VAPLKEIAMLVVINEFHIEPSKIKQATEAAKAAQAQIGKLGHKPHRILTDVTGEFYTLMFVGEFESLAALEKTMEGVMSNPDFQKAYQAAERRHALRLATDHARGRMIASVLHRAVSYTTAKTIQP
jgi:hypothetical protein